MQNPRKLRRDGKPEQAQAAKRAILRRTIRRQQPDLSAFEQFALSQNYSLQSLRNAAAHEWAPIFVSPDEPTYDAVKGWRS